VEETLETETTTSKTTVHDGTRHCGLQKLQKRSPALLVLRGAETGLRIALTSERVSLGRTIDADIVLNDKLISRRHCEVVWDENCGTFRVIDLDSTNGTFVNDRAITSCEVVDGDKIFIGSTILKFVLEDEVDNESGQLFDRLMFQDDLTGLVVPRRFNNDLRVHLQSAKVLAKSVGLLMMDLDGLKQVNDAYGHHVGAASISEVGKIIGVICNDLGEACRYGGDEFVAYLLEVDKRGALEVGEKIRSAVKEHVFRQDDLELRLSISIGVAVFPDDAKTAEALARAADAALYRAKEKGRDRVSD
jgi:diguanylate cyclase (GGDEF)-like protein